MQQCSLDLKYIQVLEMLKLPNLCSKRPRDVRTTQITVNHYKKNDEYASFFVISEKKIYTNFSM